MLFQIAGISALLAASFLAYVYVELTGGSRLGNLVLLVDVDKESNLPTFWSVMNLLVAAVMLLTITISERAAGSALRHRWMLLAVLSAALRSLDRRTRRHFVAAAIVFLTGALLIESIGGSMLHYDLVRDGDFALALEQLAEEACEMVGIAMFNVALLREMQRRGLSLAVEASSARRGGLVRTDSGGPDGAVPSRSYGPPVRVPLRWLAARAHGVPERARTTGVRERT